VADGFVGRWSRRKQQARAGVLAQETVPVQNAESNTATAAQSLSVAAASVPVPQQKSPVSAKQEQEAPALALPTLEDVKALTAESDFKPFIARDVDPEVRNAAMKKLFADPHYNVMDRLDTYIDDYSLPDPIPASMLRQLVSAKFLNLFDEDEEKKKPASPALASAPQSATPPPAASQAAESAVNPLTNPPHHDHTDLRLQQDDAAGAKSSGNGVG